MLNIGKSIEGSRVSFDVARPGAYILDVAWLFAPPVRPYQTLRLMLGGMQVGEVRVSSVCILEFFLPESGSLTIEFPDASRPIDVGMGPDTRVLSVGFARFEAKPRFEVFSGVRVLPRRTIAELSRLGVTASQLAIGVESLGDNCELGMVQREMGAEPLGLFRFSSTTPELVASLLECRFEGFGAPGSLELSIFGSAREYMVQDRRSGFVCHTWVPEDGTSPEQILSKEYERIGFLTRKFMEDALSGEKVFVFRDHGNMSAQVSSRLLTALHAIGPSRLLLVGSADGCPSQPTFEADARGLLKATIDYRGPDWWMIADTWFETLVSVLQVQAGLPL